MEQLSQAQERLEKDLSLLKREIATMNKKLNQRFEQLMKLHEDSSCSPLMADGNNKAPTEKSFGSLGMGGNGKFGSANLYFIRDFGFRKLETPHFLWN